MGRAFKVGKNIRVVLNDHGFREVRKSAGLEAIFAENGDTWVNRLNNELILAEAKRSQPPEDGYVYHLHRGTTRVRMYVVAATARAQAHERKHSSILKLMHTTGWEVKERAKMTEAQVKAQARKRAAGQRRVAREHRFAARELHND